MERACRSCLRTMTRNALLEPSNNESNMHSERDQYPSPSLHHVVRLRHATCDEWFFEELENVGAK